MTVEGTALAKINLTLHVTGQRADGFHSVDSLVVFGEANDRVIVREADTLSLVIEGPEAQTVPADMDNLMMQAAALMSVGRGAAITLIKHLPIAAGIGGGSADAAATIRALSQFWGTPLPDMSKILELGADIPVCLESRPKRVAGIGEILTPAPDMPEDGGMLLVNPRVAVSTADVFAGLRSKYNPPMADVIPNFSTPVELADWLKPQRNDLQAPAISIQPIIGAVIGAIENSASLVARMSGSGATCFGLYATEDEAKAAETAIHAAHPNWWTSWFALKSMNRD